MRGLLTLLGESLNPSLDPHTVELDAVLPLLHRQPRQDAFLGRPFVGMGEPELTSEPGILQRVFENAIILQKRPRLNPVHALHLGTDGFVGPLPDQLPASSFETARCLEEGRQRSGVVPLGGSDLWRNDSQLLQTAEDGSVETAVVGDPDTTGKLLPRTILGVADELTVRPPEGNEVAVEPLAGDVAVHAEFLHAVVASVEGLGVETEDPPATDT